MLKFVCEQCGYCDFSNKTTKCPACGGAYIKMSLIQSYKIEHRSFDDRFKYIEEKIIKHKIDQKYAQLRKDYQDKRWTEYQQQKKEDQRKERSKISAYQTKYLSFLEEAQNQGIVRSRAEDIASYAMQHDLYQLPHCPSCGSVDVNKIGTVTKVTKTAAFGVVGAMSDVGKTWKCCKCGTKW